MLYSLITTFIVVGIPSIPPKVSSTIFKDHEICEIALDDYYKNIRVVERVEVIDMIINPINKRREVVTRSSHKNNHTFLGYTICVPITTVNE